MVGAVAMLVASCSPDEVNLGDVTYKPADLTVGKAFTVTPDSSNPNVIHLQSLVKGCTPVWNTPAGRSQKSEMTLDLPFSGTYTVTFGVMTQAGTVWGEPYDFVVESNNFNMLSDEIWTNLAGGVDENGNGRPKRWVPMDKAYSPYHGSCPMLFASPEDVMNDGSGVTDLMIGTANWNNNWEPGFADWFLPGGQNDPYMHSYMEFSLSATDGCVLQMVRGTASGDQSYNGGFVLNVADASHPTISFTSGTFVMHNEGHDATCSNYINDLKIVECTPYVLQIATMRTNDEGPWWLIWSFVAEEVQNGTVEIPTDGPSLLPTTSPVEPEYTDLEESLFTVNGPEATYIASDITYLLNDEVPYDYMWWNGATSTWDNQNLYGSTVAPAYTNGEDFALTLTRPSKNVVLEGESPANTTFTINGNKIVFTDEVTLLIAGDVAIKGTEFTVLKASADDESLILGIPAGQDANGVTNRYLCANLKPKAIGGGATGPVTIAFNNDSFPTNLESNGLYMRAMIYNPWNADLTFPVDPAKLKLKKDQKFVVKFSISGVNWVNAPKVAFCCNMAGYSWEPGCYDIESCSTTLNLNGETTLELINTTGATYKFEGTDALEISIMLDGNIDVTADEVLANAKVTVSSLTIE